MATLKLSDYGRSSAGMKKQWLETLKARIEAEDPDNVTPSDLNSGIIGYSFDIMSSAIEDAYFNINTKGREIFVTNARLNDSVYAHAASAGINDFFATPAKITLLVGIKESDILNKAVERVGLGYRMLTIGTDTKFRLGEFYYTIDYPVDIVVKNGFASTKMISAKYNLGTDNKFSDIESTYIQGKLQSIKGTNYYVFKVYAHQIVKNTFAYTYIKAATETPIYEIEYDNQLAGFDVWYRPNVDADWVLLDNVYLGVISGLSSESKFCYFRLLDGSLEISFSNNPNHFSPIFNSSIKICLYTTAGSLGNFTYTDESVIVELGQDQSNLYESAIFGSIPAAQLLVPTSAGGIDSPTIDDLRDLVVRQKSSRQSIISDDDLTKAMSSYNITLGKQRDDFYERRFKTFILIKDSTTGYIVPCRTGEIFIKESKTVNQTDVDARIIPQGSVYNLWLADDNEYYNTVRFTTDDPDESGYSPTTALAAKNWSYLYNKYVDRDGLLMMCPFLIKIFKDPYFVSLFDVQCNDTLGTVFGYNDYNSPEKFSLTSMKISRLDIQKKVYTIEVELAMSDALLESFVNLDIEDFGVRVKVEMLDSDGETYAYIELTTVTSRNGKLIFSAELETDDVLHSDDKLRIVNGTIIPTADEVYTDTGIIPSMYYIPFSSKLRVYVVHKPDTSFSSSYRTYLLSDREKSEGFIVTDMFETNENFDFVRDVSNLFTTALEVTMSDGVWPKYGSDVPMYYDTIIYEKDGDGIIIMNGDGTPKILHDVGDPVLQSDGITPVYAHRAGDDIVSYDAAGNGIYEIPPEVTYIIKNVPMVSMMAMLNPVHRDLIYDQFKNLVLNLQENILPRIVENNALSVGVYNTVGPSSTYVCGSDTDFVSLDKLDLSIELNVKLRSNDNKEALRENISLSAETYMKSIVTDGRLYVFEMIEYLKDLYSDIEYVEFDNINGLNTKVQTVKKNPDIDSSKIVPEFISVGQTLDKEAFKADGTVSFTPNIVINIIV